ncbi:V-type ATP synthase subunit A, partial [archaeon]|nr:V-type ATP synthase subunit A [archaeon]
MGKISRIAGHIIEAEDLKDASMNSKVLIGKQNLIGEIIKLKNDTSIIQVFEDTDRLKIGDTVKSLNTQITATLGPGLLGMVYDGLQRPLNRMDDFIAKGTKTEPLDTKKKWKLKKIKDGEVKKGDIIA